MPNLDDDYYSGSRETPPGAHASRAWRGGSIAAGAMGVVLLLVLIAGYAILHQDRRTGAVGYATGGSGADGTVSQRKPVPGIPFPASGPRVAAATAPTTSPDPDGNIVTAAPGAAPDVAPATGATFSAAGETPARLGPARNAPGVYLAKHQKSFGRGCDGKLALTDTGLDFACTEGSDAPLHFTLDEIKGANGNGIQLKNGEKYHFDLGTSKAEAQQIFTDWAAAHVAKE